MRLDASFSCFLMATTKICPHMFGVSGFPFSALFYCRSVRNDQISSFEILPRTVLNLDSFTPGSASLHPGLLTYHPFRVGFQQKPQRNQNFTSSHFASRFAFHIPQCSFSTTLSISPSFRPRFPVSGLRPFFSMLSTLSSMLPELMDHINNGTITVFYYSYYFIRIL